MRYIKQFENNNEPKVGDYVVCHENSQNVDSDMNFFLSQNIGKIESIGGQIESIYYVEFDYYSIPVKLIENFDNENILQFFKNEILFYSYDEEECEIYMDSNKYNI
jgi:hypothetical protein